MKLGFKFGKKGKGAEQEEVLEDGAADASAESSAEADIITDVEPVRPHAPIQELSLDAVAGTAEGGQEEPLDAGAEEEGEPVKLAEIQLNPAASAPPPPPPPPTPAPAAKDTSKDAGGKGGALDLSTSIGNIFNNIEDEENPLANLIKSLPEVAATELIDDLKEINDIIKDWQKK